MHPDRRGCLYGFNYIFFTPIKRKGAIVNSPAIVYPPLLMSTSPKNPQTIKVAVGFQMKQTADKRVLEVSDINHCKPYYVFFYYNFGQLAR